MELDGIGSLLGIQKPWLLRGIKVQEKNMVIDVYIDFERGSKFPCSCCGHLASVHDSSYKRIRYLDLFDFRCYLNIKTPRLSCDRDGVRVAHADSWGRQGSHYSFKFEALVMRLCREMSVTAVSQELGEPDQNLWRVFRYHVKERIIPGFDFRDVRRVCVDETAVKRGHNYISIFTDYDTGNVLFVTEGRKKDVFSSFYGWLWDNGGHPRNIEVFSMDMSTSYRAGQREYFANSEVVFDRFHVKKALNKAVNSVRNEEVKTVEALKKTKYIWLKNEGNLTEKQRHQLEIFLNDSSLKTGCAYQLKSSFDQLWNVQKHAVEPLLRKWIDKALGLDLKPIYRFVDTVCEHYDGILGSIITGITNAVSEGLNSVIQLARSRARGFKNVENFSMMVYYLGNT